MYNIISLIISIIFYIVFSIYFIKKQNSEIKKNIFVIIFSVLFVPILFMELDRFDFFSIIGWLENLDSERWFSFFSQYISSFLGAILSGFILISITNYQLEKSQKFNLLNQKEVNMINNKPIIIYELMESKEFIDLENADSLIFINDSKNKENTYHCLELNLKNLGLNLVRDFYVVFSSNNLNGDKKTYYNYGRNIIEKNSSQKIRIVLFASVPLVEELSIDVQYMDILNNCYEQKVKYKIDSIDKDTVNINKIGEDFEKNIDLSKYNKSRENN